MLKSIMKIHNVIIKKIDKSKFHSYLLHSYLLNLLVHDMINLLYYKLRNLKEI